MKAKVFKNIDELLCFVKSIQEKNTCKKPVMIWFNDNPVLDKVNKIIADLYPKMTKINAPSLRMGYGQDVSLFVCHQYVNQMDAEALEYYCNLCENTHKPVLCFANMYSYKDRPAFVSDKFDEYHLKVKSVIVINHMFTGKYLNQNIGHEIINLFSDDYERNYVYLCKDGSFNRDDLNVEYIVNVRRPDKTKATLEIINVAEDLTLYKKDDAPLPTYGGENVYNIFKKNKLQQDVCVTFEANQMLKPSDECGGKLYIYEGGKNDKIKEVDKCGITLKDFKSSQQLREYIVCEEVDDKNPNYHNYQVLRSFIKLRCRKCTLPKVDLSIDTSVNVSEIYGIQDKELPFSDALKYFIKKYPKMFTAFFKMIPNGDGIKDVFREVKKVDLTIECEKTLLVIENKIFSDLNGNEEETQLKKYQTLFESPVKSDDDEWLKNMKSKKNKFYILLVPNHNNITLPQHCSNWLRMEYKTLYDFIVNSKEYNDDNELNEFAKALKPHTENDFNFSIMQKRFVRAIK